MINVSIKLVLIKWILSVWLSTNTQLSIKLPMSRHILLVHCKDVCKGTSALSRVKVPDWKIRERTVRDIEEGHRGGLFSSSDVVTARIPLE